LLVDGLGVERFGALGLAWTLLAYFGMFDLGLALATTRFVAATLARADPASARATALRSFGLHAILGIVAALLFALLAPYLASRVFALPAALVDETTTALYWLALSLPAVVLGAACRGVLEGMQRFATVNLVRIPASIVNYAVPLAAMTFDHRLPLVVASISIARYIVLLAYAALVLRYLPRPTQEARPVPLRQLATYSGWLMGASVLGPAIVAADRLIIGATISASAVAFYVTPYEVITRGWILSASVMGALFPVLTGLGEKDPAAVRSVCRSAEVGLLALALPPVVAVIGCADLLLGWWLGPQFAAESSTAARLLALGLLVNIVAQVPFTALNALGKARLTTLIAAVELPLYAGAVWYAARRFGIDGVAAVWALRAAIDCAVAFAAAHWTLPAGPRRDTGWTRAAPAVIAFVVIAWWLPGGAILRLALVAVLLAVVLAWEWRFLLGARDRQLLYSLIPAR
jgi:O-antigen/teichoic acid export membrane protein